MKPTVLTHGVKSVTITVKQPPKHTVYEVVCFKDGRKVKLMSYKTSNRADAFEYANWWLS